MVSVDEGSLSEFKLNRPEFCPVKWLDGVQVTDAAPRYVMLSQKMLSKAAFNRFVQQRRGVIHEVESSNLVVRNGDLGGGIVAHSAPRHPRFIEFLY